MIYWLLFKRSFRSFPLFFTMYFIAIASFLVALYVKPHYTVYFFGFLSFLCGLALCPMVYVVCRKSTLMVPDFKRINANFYIFSGLLIVYLFLLSLIPNLGKGSINPVYLFLLYMGTGFFIYGLLLFTIPFLRKYFFLFFLLAPLLQNSQVENILAFIPSHCLQFAILFFLAGLILTFLYRSKIINLTEDSVFFRLGEEYNYWRYSGFNVKKQLQQMKLHYSKRGLFMGGYRFTFEFFLNLLGNLRISRNARKFILTVLEHNMDFLSFTNIIWVIVVVSVSSFYTNMGHYPSSSTVLILFYWWFLMFFSAIGISMMDRNIKQDSTKPVSRAGLLIVTYAGIYIRTIITLIVLFIGVSIGMSMANLKIAISQLSLFPGILIVFLFVALLIIVRRFIKIFLWGLLLFPVIQSLISRNIASQKFFEGTYLPKIFVPAAIMLTGLFLIVAFRLDIKKDIA